ncbi:MAG: low molecular weight protein-tyrosine-phosphatase [Planctomycetota bacterium]
MTQSQSILFVCLGNICRSPLAEGVFVHRMTEAGMADRFRVDSAGTGNWHAGERADARMRETASRHGVPLHSRARQVVADDFSMFDHIIAMDDSNVSELLERGCPQDRLRLLLEVDPDASVREVPDPYYGGADGFEEVFQLVDRACARLLEELTDGKSGS